MRVIREVVYWIQIKVWKGYITTDCHYDDEDGWIDWTWCTTFEESLEELPTALAEAHDVAGDGTKLELRVVKRTDEVVSK